MGATVAAGKPLRNGAAAADGSSRLSPLRTIRARLYLAFGFAASMTVVGSFFALYAFANLGATMNDIASRSMPATIKSVRLSEEASSLVSSAPRLMAAEDERHRGEIAGDIAAQSQSLKAIIERLRALDASQSDELEVAQAALAEELDALNKAVADRIKLSDRRRALVLAARKYHEELNEAITPAARNRTIAPNV